MHKAVPVEPDGGIVREPDSAANAIHQKIAIHFSVSTFTHKLVAAMCGFPDPDRAVDTSEVLPKFSPLLSLFYFQLQFSPQHVGINVFCVVEPASIVVSTPCHDCEAAGGPLVGG